MPAFGACTAYGTVGRTLKYGFYITNITSVLICLACAGFGLYMGITRKPYAPLIDPRPLYVDVANILVVIGLMAVANAFIGFYSASKELRCFIYTYSVANSIIFIMLVIGGVMGFVFQDRLLNKIPLDVKMLSSLQQLYGLKGSEEITKAWDDLQTHYECCGVNGTDNYEVWHRSKWFMQQDTEPKFEIPLSCCRIDKSDHWVDKQKCRSLQLNQTPDTSVMNMPTCYEPLKNDLSSVTHVAAILSIICGSFLLIPAAFAAGYSKVIQK